MTLIALVTLAAMVRRRSCRKAARAARRAFQVASDFSSRNRPVLIDLQLIPEGPHLWEGRARPVGFIPGASPSPVCARVLRHERRSSSHYSFQGGLPCTRHADHYWSSQCCFRYCGPAIFSSRMRPGGELLRLQTFKPVKGCTSRWTAPPDCQQSESNAGVTLTSPDGRYSAFLATLLRSKGSRTPLNFLQSVLSRRRCTNVRSSPQRTCRPRTCPIECSNSSRAPSTSTIPPPVKPSTPGLRTNLTTGDSPAPTRVVGTGTYNSAELGYVPLTQR
jgi:hypothetical protein